MQDWERASGGHSPQIPGSQDAPCKCENAMGIECYANPAGVTRRITGMLVRGPALIQVPAGVIEEWKKALAGGGLSATFYRPVVFHTKVPVGMKPPPNLKSHLKTTVTYSADSSRFASSFHPALSFAFVPGGNRHGSQPERFIMLTTHESTRVKAAFQMTLADSSTAYGCPVGLHVVDEFHAPESRLESSAPLALARQHRQIRDGDVDFWAVTGTPFPTGSLADVWTAMAMLQRPEWVELHRHSGRTVAKLNELVAEHEAAVSPQATAAQQESFRQLARGFFSRDLVIRNVEDTTFFGRVITCMDPAHRPEALTVFTPRRFAADVQAVSRQAQACLKAMLGARQDNNMDPGPDDLQRAVRSACAYAALEPLQVLSTFPGAARLMLSGKMRFDRQALRQAIQAPPRDGTRRSRHVGEVALFHAVLDDVVEDSPKLDLLLMLISYMLESDTEVRAEPQHKPSSYRSPFARPPDPGMKKMVIMTPSLAEAVFLYLAILKKKPAGGRARPVLFHANLKASEKELILKDWENLTSTARHRVFIACFADAGTGLNLQAASFQVLTGPLRSRSQELQAFRRTNRDGQQLSLTHYLLADEDNPHDRLMMAIQANHTVVSDPFTIGEPLQLAGTLQLADERTGNGEAVGTSV